MEARHIAFDSVEPTRNELGHVVAMIAQAEAELNDTLTLMKAMPQDGFRFRRLEQESAEIEARHAQLTARKTALEEAIRRQVFSLSDIADAVRFRGDAESGLTDATAKDKRRWLEMLKVKAQVTTDGKVVVTCALPVKDGVITLYSS